MRRRHAIAGRRLALAAVAGAVLSFAGAAQAQQSPIFDDLLEKLKDKGVLTQEEFDALKAARDEERTMQRAERRERALREAQAAEREEKAKAEAPSRLTGTFKEGFGFESGDKKHSIALSGRFHGDYRAFFDDTAANTFDVRRAYLGVSGKLYDIYTFDVTGDFAQSGTTLDVAWFNAAWFKPAQFRIGQFKMPFSLEELTSSRFIDFQERSMMNALVPAKERGLMVHGDPFKGVTYGVALSNGQGKNNNEPNPEIDSPDLIARVAGNAAEWIGQPNMVLHAGLNYSTGTLQGGSAPLSGRTEARGVTFFQTGNMGTTATEVDRERLGGEVSLAYGPFKLQGEYTQANFDWTAGAGSFDNDIDAYYAMASWIITGESYAKAYRPGGYRAIVPEKSFGSGGWGALELAVRYSEFDAEDFTPTATTTNKADAWTIGLKWIPVTNVRFYLNYVDTDFDTPVTVNGEAHDDEQAVTFRAAIYF
jgi:phosphate-selective porin OprO and OprP